MNNGRLMKCLQGRRSMPSWVVLGCVLLCILMFSGCTGTGASSIKRDRFDYVTSVSDSWKRQMLLNLLKVRYTDAPIFMDIASVINSYELTGEVNLLGQVAKADAGDQIASLGMTGRYADKPTITYQPLAGEKFTRSLMMPIPVTGILSLIQSGYPANMVMRICVNSINGLENSFGGAGRHQVGDPKFSELLTVIRDTQSAGGMGMRIKSSLDKQTTVMFLRPLSDEAAVASSRRIRELLGLNATAREFAVVFGSYPENDKEIAILSRSILEILSDLASYVDVPDIDVEEGRVYQIQRAPDQEKMFPPLLKVRCTSAAPSDAYVAVNYRNHWFWIDDRDRSSKQMFNTLMFMFSLTETDGAQSAPIVTIPAR